MNHYVAPTIPPGWDDWRVFTHGWGYYGYRLHVNGRIVEGGRRPADYSTDALGRMAARFVRAAPEPFFLLFAPAAAHFPATPAPRHVGRRLRLRPFAPPSFLERGERLRDKPRYVREGWLWQTPSRRAFRARQYRTLLAVDDAVGRIVGALRRSGRLRDTVIVFTSDNGVMWGEHGFPPLRKAVPYESAIRVPLVVRYDAGADRARVDHRLVANVDIAPTLAQLARVRFAAHGRSLLPLLRGRRDVRWRTQILIQNMGGEHRGSGIPTWCGVRSELFVYVVYGTGEEELYDLALDPYQLENVARVPAYDRTRTRLRTALRRLCVPRPPGYAPPGL